MLKFEEWLKIIRKYPIDANSLDATTFQSLMTEYNLWRQSQSSEGFHEDMQNIIVTGQVSKGSENDNKNKNGITREQVASGFSTAGAIADSARGFLFGGQTANDSGLTKGINSAYDSVSSSLMAFSPVGCVCAGSRIITNVGEFKNIENLLKEDGIIGWGDKKTRKQNIYSFKKPEYKECLRIETLNGLILECSIDHPILSDKAGRAKYVKIDNKQRRVRQWEFRRADLLNIGDFVGVGNYVDIWGNEEMWNPYLIGLLIGDGTYGKDHGVRLYSADKNTWDYIENNNLGCQIKHSNSDKYSKEFRAYRIYNGPSELRKLGIYELTKFNKSLPNDIFKYSKLSICKLLAGLFDTDGYISENIKNKEGKVVFCQSNLRLLKLVKEQLFKLGIHSSILKIKERESVHNNYTIKSKLSFKLIIKDKLSIINFYNLIPLNIDYKKYKLKIIYDYCSKGKFKDNRHLSGAKADKIIKITSIGQQLVYNLQADDDHTYLANFIITHNTIVGGAMKVGAFVGDAMQAIGGGTDLQTKTDLLMDSSLFSWNVGLVNGFGGSKTQDFSVNKQTVEQIGGSYGGTVNNLNLAAEHAGKKYGLFSQGSKNRWNDKINTARQLQNTMTDIANNASDMQSIASSMSDINHLNYSYNMSGGYDLRYMRAARIGGRIELDWQPELELSWQPEIALDWTPSFKSGGELNIEIELDWQPEFESVELDWTPSFKDGGKVESEPTDEEKELQVDTNQMNVIPEGALHKNKHHIENTEDYTQKGIPVVDIDGEQQAEIECNEIIFTLEVTLKLEEWYKEFYNEETSNARKDEVAILAGKLLVEQILYNTDDRTGLIDTLKKGGNIPVVNKEFKQTNNITQDLITEMVKQALLNILMK